MSEQFFYVYLKFVPKIVTLAEPILRPHEVVVKFRSVSFCSDS
jgi:hypothetical protein